MPCDLFFFLLCKFIATDWDISLTFQQRGRVVRGGWTVLLLCMRLHSYCREVWVSLSPSGRVQGGRAVDSTWVSNCGLYASIQTKWPRCFLATLHMRCDTILGNPGSRPIYGTPGLALLHAQFGGLRDDIKGGGLTGRPGRGIIV